MSLIGTLNTFVNGTTIQATPVNENFADIKTAFNTYAVLVDVARNITVSHDWDAPQDFDAGTEALPGIYLNGDVDTGWYEIAAGNWGFSVAGSKVLDISATGVGLTGALTVSSTLGVTGNATVGGTLGVTGAVTGASFAGSGTGLTGLNATQLTGGTVPTARIVGSYPNISGVGTLTVGVWNATTIAVGYGGTGLTSYASGDILYATGASTLAKLPKGSNGDVLSLSSGLPSWSSAAGRRPITITGGTMSDADFPGASGSNEIVWPKPSNSATSIAYVVNKSGTLAGFSFRFTCSTWTAGTFDVELEINGIAYGDKKNVAFGAGTTQNIFYNAASTAISSGDRITLVVKPDASYNGTGEEILAASIHLLEDWSS